MPRRIVKFNVISIAVALLYSITARGEPAVEDHPFTENHWHQLSCGVQRDVRWNCSWDREDEGGTFHPVKVNTEFVKRGPLPTDLDVYLNDATKGTYWCSCQVSAEQTQLMKVIVFYSADQRFRKDPSNVTVEAGKLFNLTVCYLKHLPESVNLTKIALVEEATGNPTIVSLDRTNYCAQFPLQDPQPGTYHFKVTVHYGNVISRSFHIGVVQPPTEATDDALDGTTTAVMAALIPIVVLVLGVTVCVIIGGCLWKRRRKKRKEEEDGINCKL